MIEIWMFIVNDSFMALFQIYRENKDFFFAS